MSYRHGELISPPSADCRRMTAHRLARPRLARLLTPSLLTALLDICRTRRRLADAILDKILKYGAQQHVSRPYARDAYLSEMADRRALSSPREF